MCNGHFGIGVSLIIHFLELFRRKQQLIDKWIRVIGNFKRIIGSSDLTTQSILRKDVYFWFLPDFANNSIGFGAAVEEIQLVSHCQNYPENS